MEGQNDEQAEPEAHQQAVRSVLQDRTLAIACVSAVALTVLGAGALAGAVPGVPLRSGPLEGGSATYLQVPIERDHEGVFWGVLELKGTASGSLVLDSVELDRNPGNVKLTSAPYIWGDGRTEVMTDGGGVSAWSLPLPADWSLPPKQEVEGLELQDEDGAQVVFELAAPKKASTVEGIKVRYHAGWLAYEKTFDMSITLCPANDPALCQ